MATTHLSVDCSGPNGSTQHWREDYLQESQKLKSFAGVESNGTLPLIGQRFSWPSENLP
jgi:hypothetical protein